VTYQELAKNSQFGSFFDGAITQYELTGTLSWEADIWGKIRSSKRAFEASYLQSVAAHQAVKTELVANIASVYFQLLAFDEQLRMTEETIRNRERSLETTKALKDAGNVTEVGVKQTEAQLYTARAIAVDIRTNIRTLENTMSILLGKEPQAIDRSTLDQQNLSQELNTGFPVQLLRNRPDVIAAEYNLINAFELTNVAKSNFYPSLTLSATSGLQSLEFDKLFSVNSVFATIIGSVTQPIFNGRRIRTQYEVAQAQREIAYLNFKQSILNASREVSDALYTYHAAQERIQIRAQEFEAYDVATSYSEELLNNGLASYLEVLTARENALNSQINLINARFTRLNAVVEVYRALGGGWQ
jgi:NodT family efflux transporter outer membrane factor (OMF) lipoprotein